MSAAGQEWTSSPGVSGGAGPRTHTVPSTVPVAPVYAGRCIGFTTASMLARGT